MANGYAGRILRVDLDSGRTSIETVDEDFHRVYLGGWGIIAYYLFNELKRGIDPLGSENKLIFAGGILTGAPLSGCGRSAMGAKSPVTGGFGEADIGGFFGAEMTRAGWDALIVEGKSKAPVYLFIMDDRVELRDASKLWGRDTLETQEDLKEELGDKRTRFAVIGKAGENLVPFACVVYDDNHVAGRAGLGAVMGSKNLKAVAVRGSGAKEVHDRDKLKEISQWLSGEGKKLWEPLHEHGTDRGLKGLSEMGGLPTRNFNLGHFDEAEQITGTTMSESILVDRTTCYSCVVRCKRAVEVKEGPFKVSPAYGGPEYETAAALGSNCGVSDLHAVAAGNQLCNANGLDTISGGMMVSFAMECFESGIITEEDTGGLELRFGNAEAMVKLLEMIVNREGIGDLLGRGYAACIEAWGPEAEDFAIQVKGQPLPMHEPRLKFGLGLGYAISPTGADHVHNLHDTLFATEENLFKLRPYGILKPVLPQELSGEKIRLFYYVSMNELLKNMLGLCAFLPYDPNRIVDIARAITGWDTSLAELFKGAERGMAMARAFNAREGFTAEDDKLPDRFFESFAEGPLKGVFHDRDEFQSALEKLYSVLGWDPGSGAPTRGKYAELGLDWMAEQMERDGVG